MKKIGILTCSLAVGIVFGESASAVSDQNTGPHSVTITHPIHGTITVPVHKSDVGTRHPESNVQQQKGSTNKGLGCSSVSVQ